MVLRALAQHFDAFVSRNPLPPPPTITVPPEEQRVIPLQQSEEQRVIPIQQPPLQRVSTAPATMLANNQTALWVLCMKPRTHQQKTRANTPGTLPIISHAHRVPPLLLFTKIVVKPTAPSTAATTTAKPCQSNWLNSAPIPRFNNVHFITQEATNSLVVNNANTRPKAFTPLRLHPAYMQQNPEHYSVTMVHPITGKHITSYRKLMQDPAMSEVWMTAFSKDSGSMCQGDNKTKTKGTNAIFVMDPKDIPNIPKTQPPTYAKVIIAYRP
jgi:hypothetical protein